MVNFNANLKKKRQTILVENFLLLRFVLPNEILLLAIKKIFKMQNSYEANKFLPQVDKNCTTCTIPICEHGLYNRQDIRTFELN